MKNPETNSSWLGEILSENADAMVMLSATPLHLGTEDLFNQLRILSPSDFQEFVFFHDLIEPNEHVNAALRLLQMPRLAAEALRRVEMTSQRDRFLNNPNYRECVAFLSAKSDLSVGEAVSVQRQLTELNTLSHMFTRTRRRDIVTHVHFPERHAHVIDVDFTPEEVEVYQAVTQWVMSRYAQSDAGFAFALIMPQRQVSSCIPAMKSYLEDLLGSGRIRGPRADDGDVVDLDAVPDADDDAGDAPLPDSELGALRRLQQALDRLGDCDTKFERFLAALREIRSRNPDAKIVVFAFFKRTLEYLLRQLTRHGIAATLIYGDERIPPKERQRRVRQFWEDRELPVLLSSEVGGEGLDFQIASVLFNYDLPWNPMRVEQRIGRLDRYGQQSEKILIYNFSMKGTIDDIILDKLYGRINIFERYIGDLEAILGNRVNELVSEMFNPEFTDDDRRRRADKIGENLVRAQEELERFEHASEQFIGQDEFFTREITRIRETKRFVTAEEVQFLLQSFIDERCSGTTLRPPKRARENVLLLRASDEFRAFVLLYAPDDDAKKEVLRQLAYEQGVLVTFDSDAACKDDGLLFITMHSPIVKAIVRFWTEGESVGALPLGRLRLASYRGATGLSFLFIYLLEKTGARKQLQLEPILVSALDSSMFHLRDEVTEALLGKLIEAEELTEEMGITDADVVTAEGVADEWITMIREEEETKLRRENEVLVNNRIESIKQTLELKEQRVRRTLDKLLGKQGADSPIARLHRGRLRNIRAKAEAEIRRWDGRRPVSVGYRRIAGGLLYFS